MADGSIKIDTKIDDKGAKTGIKKLGGSLKSFGKTTGKVLAAGAAGITAMATGFIVAAKNTAAFGDNVDKMSQKLNISREGFQKWDFVLSQNGANINDLGVGMKALQQKMDDANQGAKSGTELFKRLGISLDEVRESSPEEIFEKTVEQLQKMPAGAEKSALAFEAFGRQGQELAPLLNQSAEATEELKQKAVDMGMIMSDEAIDATANFTDSLDILKRTLTGAKNKMAGEFLPALTKVTDGFAKLLTGDEGGLAQVDEGISEFMDKFNDLLPKVLEIGSKIITSLIDGIVDNLPQVVESTIIIIKTLVDGIIDNLPALLGAALEIIITLAKGLVEALPELVDSAIEIVLKLVDYVTEHIDEFITLALFVIETLAEGLIKAIPKLVDSAIKIILGLVDYMVDHIEEIVKLALYIIVELAKGLIKAIPKLITAVPKLIGALVKAFGDQMWKIVDIGKNIVKGIWEGIKSMAKWIGDKVSEFFGGIIDGAKDVLEIHSPSKVFARIGKFTAEGFGNGFDEQMENVRKQIQAAIPTSLDTSATINAGADTIKAGNSITQYLTINTPKHLSPSETANLNENMLQRALWGI